MAQNVIINGVTYQSVPEVDIPKSGGGTAKFYDTAGADAAAADILTGKTAYGANGSVSGSMANNGSTSGPKQALSPFPQAIRLVEQSALHLPQQQTL